MAKINKDIQNALQGKRLNAPLGSNDPYEISQVINALMPDKTVGAKGITGKALAPKPAYNDDDYDYDGYIAKYGPPDQSKGQHLTDEFKLPSHITFSDQSRYHDDNMTGGRWLQGGQDKWIFVPSAFNLKQYSPDDYADYFSKRERKGTLVQLPDGRLVEGGMD